MKSKMKVLLTVAVLCLSVFMFAGCSDKTDKPADSGDAGTPAVTYNKGVVTGNTFESEFLNLKFVAPADYMMASQDELDGVIMTGLEEKDIVYADAEKTKLDYSKIKTVYEMMATANAGSPSVSLAVENLAVQKITQEKYIEAIKAQLANVKEFKYVIDDQLGKETIAGVEYDVLSTSVQLEGEQLIQEYMLHTFGDHLACFILTYTSSEADGQARTELLKAFTPLK